jgi:hypothetical protein
MRLRAVFVLLVFGAMIRSAAADSILVYDENTHNHLALQAAQATPGAVVVRATAQTFGTLLRNGTWDLVLADMPSTLPSANGLGALTDYVNKGGKAAMSFWTWQTEQALSDAFGVTPLQNISLTGGATLFDFGTSNVFAGVTMPNADWNDHWNDDGDVFSLRRGGDFLAGLGPHASPVMALTNGGRTIAAPLFDEAGNRWLNDGSGQRLWGNMIGLLAGSAASPTPEPASLLLLTVGLGAAVRWRSRKLR